MCAPLMARAWLTHMLQANRQRPSISNTACTRPDQGGRLGQGAPCVDGAWVARAHPLHSPRGQCRRMRRPPPQAAPSACAHIYRPWRLLSRGLEGARRSKKVESWDAGVSSVAVWRGRALRARRRCGFFAAGPGAPGVPGAPAASAPGACTCSGRGACTSRAARSRARSAASSPASAPSTSACSAPART